MDISVPRFNAVVVIVLLLLAVSAFTLSASHAALLQSALVMAALGISFQIVYTLLGQLSLGHSALFGAGAYTYAYMAVNGYTLPLAAIAACAVGAVVGLIVSAATARLGGAYFAVVTFALASVISVVVSSSKALGLSEGLVGIPSFTLIDLGSRPANQTIYAGAGFVAVLIGFYSLWRSRFGWMLEAVRTNPRLAASLGINVPLATIVATVISGLFAGMVGALAAQQTRFVGPDVFGIYYIVTPLTAVVIGGARSLVGAAAGVLIVFVIPVALSISPVLNHVVSGVLLAIFAIFFPSGIMGAVERFVRTKTVAVPRSDARVDHSLLGAAGKHRLRDTVLLKADHVSVAYGGLNAVTDMSLALHSGHVTGLIGANGAGKSSLVNALSGHVRSSTGEVHLMGSADVSRLPSYLRARGGLARTFQDNAVIETLTVYQSVILARSRGRWLATKTDNAPSGDAIIGACGLQVLKSTKVERLSYMHRRMTALAMAVAMDTGVLFLDEATAGLTADDRAQIGSFLKSLATDFGLAILVIEHDVEFVASIADHIIVMDGGRLLHEGKPKDVLRDPKVIASYLGNEWDASQPV